MSSPLALVQIVLPVFLLIGVGYVIRRCGILTKQADDSLISIVIKLFVPCLALDVIVGNEALTRPENLFLPPVLGFLSIVVGVGVSLGAARLFLKDPVVQRTFACTTGMQNYGYIPLPLCAALFDREVVGILFAFNLGVEVAMWSIAVATVSGHGVRPGWWKQLINPPILAVLAGILINLGGAADWIPVSVSTAWHMLGVCAVPLALLLTGAVLADYATPHVLRSGWNATALSIAIRLGIVPAILLAIAFLVPADPSLRAVLAVQAAMPAAVFPIVLSKIHNGDMPTALRVVLGTSIASLLTIPFVLTFGLWLLENH